MKTMKQNIANYETFSLALFEKRKGLNSGIGRMELYEFRYCLNNLTPSEGWDSLLLESSVKLEKLVASRSFFDSIQIKPRQDNRLVLDEKIVWLTRTLLTGLYTGFYPEEWILKHFYFDIRGFLFLCRTVYFTKAVKDHFGGNPFGEFPRRQLAFDSFQDVGYQEFKEANREVDEMFINSIVKLIDVKGPPILIAIAGPTAAGKTEITDRLREIVEAGGKKTATIELDNFLTDREGREAKGIFTQGKEALHFDLLTQSLHDICRGKTIQIPRYDFIVATSSHDDAGNLKPDGIPITIEPADIIFIEGNFPFLIEEVAQMITVKIVYLTDDPVRMKRKWKRDIDYRKKYDPNYFCNRYFKDQHIMAEIAYRPQLEVCDIAVDTTEARLWLTPETSELLTWE